MPGPVAKQEVADADRPLIEDEEDLTPIAVRRDREDSDDSVLGIMRRAKQFARDNPGEPEWDPQSKMRVWMRPTGRTELDPRTGKREIVHSPQLRPVTTDYQEAVTSLKFDFWLREQGTWLRNGQKRESDSDAYRDDNLVVEE